MPGPDRDDTVPLDDDDRVILAVDQLFDQFPERSTTFRLATVAMLYQCTVYTTSDAAGVTMLAKGLATFPELPDAATVIHTIDVAYRFLQAVADLRDVSMTDAALIVTLTLREFPIRWIEIIESIEHHITKE